MNVFKVMCATAAVGLLVASAFSQGPLDKKGGGSPVKSGGGDKGVDRGGPIQRGGGDKGVDRGGPIQRGGGDKGGPIQRGGGNSQNGGGQTKGSGGGNSGPIINSGGAGGNLDKGRGGGSQNGGGQGRGSNGGPINRGNGDGPVWPSNRPNGDFGGPKPRQENNVGNLLYKKPNRSGAVAYGGNSNVQARTKMDAFVVGRAPKIDVRRGTLGNQVIRREQVGLNIGGVRVYYYHYDPRWCDDYFWYPYYCFTPYGNQCLVSPWYYYPSLPGYVRYDRCRFNNYGPWNIGWAGSAYTWNRPNYNNSNSWGYQRGQYSDLDYAIDDIVNAFERSDRRAVGRLMPESSDIAIYVDGDYSYTLNSSDFYDMYTDAIENTRTRRYVITDVQTGRDSARVTARHDYEDPWGRQVSVWHYYELRNERHNMVITRFGVSGNDRW